MKMTKKIFISLLLMVFAPLAGMAQDNVEAEVEVTLLSKYLWRGQQKGGVSLQPGATLSWKGAFVNVEGSKGFNREDEEELDINIGYQFPFGLNVGLSDMWNYEDRNHGQYFFYKDKETSHQLEGNIGYSCRYFDLQAYCMFWGNDYKLDGSRAYSTYVELAVPFKLGGLDWTLSAGMTPMESAGAYTTLYDEKGQEEGWERNYFYADGPACVSAVLRAQKELRYKSIEIPVFVELNTNPYMKTAAFLAGFTFKPF